MRLEESSLLEPEILQASMKQWFEKSRIKEVKKLHRDIVDHLVELAFKISIVEKFQDNSQVQMTQMDFMKKSEVEIQASRF